MNLMSCLMLAYAVWSLHGVYKRSHAVIAPANLYVSDYQVRFLEGGSTILFLLSLSPTYPFPLIPPSTLNLFFLLSL
jgi:hypothetical protein